MKIHKFFKAILFNFRSLKRTNKIEKLYFDKKYIDCVALCNSSIEKYNDDFFAHYYLGLANHHLKFIDKSTLNLRTALALKSNSFSKMAIRSYRNYAKLKIAMNLRKLRKYEEAFKEIKLNIIDDPKYIDHYILEANIHEDLDQSIQAIDSINNGLVIKPKNSDLLEYKNSLVYHYSVEQSENRNNG